MASLPFLRPCRLFLLLFLAVAVGCSGGGAASGYNRPKARETLFVSVADDADGNTPQQVHISMVGPDRMRVTWITENDAPATVDYGTETENYGMSSVGSTSSYSYTMLYKSGNIHEAVIGPLVPGTVYYYRCSGNPSREFFFKTPPAKLPIKFVVIGDLGQTGWTNSTLTHISNARHDVLLLPGDLSYADFYQPRWDSFARLVEPLASSHPWMVTQGNHDIESIPFLQPKPFKSYNARWHMPFEQSDSPSNLFYSFDAAGGQVHVVMLGSYADFEVGSEQYGWLKGDLEKVDRERTAWVIGVLHAPWYNTNEAHQGEGEGMRKTMEEVIYEGRVDVVFAGHVHAYERFVSVYKFWKIYIHITLFNVIYISNTKNINITYLSSIYNFNIKYTTPIIHFYHSYHIINFNISFHAPKFILWKINM
ncbi:putative purple acid phosphatase 20 [Dendrobium catenatum]|uniref:Purple acid phosphatase n=1 Tax=Dendrobium catenatum TaxID=906689 RepID=A0A2I0VLR6_9ASPA|nr:putative purple acid phosphatase 20 [Dendrobium catenatum]